MRRIGTCSKCGWSREFSQWGGQLDVLQCRKCGHEFSGVGVFAIDDRYRWWKEEGYLIDGSWKSEGFY